MDLIVGIVRILMETPLTVILVLLGSVCAFLAIVGKIPTNPPIDIYFWRPASQ